MKKGEESFYTKRSFDNITDKQKTICSKQTQQQRKKSIRISFTH